jgi:hypothetical protein
MVKIVEQEDMVRIICGVLDAAALRLLQFIALQ